MKGINLSCASPASTAICVSAMDQRSMVRHGGGRAIDRHNPHLRDVRHDKNSTAGRAIATIDCLNNSVSSSQSHSQSQLVQPPTKYAKAYHHRKTKKKPTRTSSAKPTSPPGSSRYLLSETSITDVVTEREPLPSSLVSIQSKGSWPSVHFDEFPAVHQTSSSSSTATPSNEHQVVVLRVSLHCKGCEGKVRKHISKMKGVTSFNIDFAMKKVTVVGDVTPLGVLASISRVKNAKFWPSLSSSSSIKPTHH
ncbi:hypothetical protein ACHQM5_029907 [Ranunculus cassubicifolius]